MEQLLRLTFVVRDVRALVDGGKETGTPQFVADDGDAGAQHDEARQVLVLRAETVSDP